MGTGLSVWTVHPFNNEKRSDKSSFGSPPPKEGGGKRGNLGEVGVVGNKHLFVSTSKN